jgi:hypothetical protein
MFTMELQVFKHRTALTKTLEAIKRRRLTIGFIGGEYDKIYNL